MYFILLTYKPYDISAPLIWISFTTRESNVHRNLVSSNNSKLLSVGDRNLPRDTEENVGVEDLVWFADRVLDSDLVKLLVPLGEVSVSRDSRQS